MADTYLVTGGGGFIGSHVVDELLTRGHAVKVLDNFSTGRRQNVAHFHDDIELVEGDVRSYERANTAVKGVDVVIHLAALPSVPRSVQDPLTTTEVNVTGTLNVLLAARDWDVRRVVLASSSSVYGANDFLPKHEELIPHPISPYGVSKLAGEYYCQAFTACYGLETVALRYFNIYGPRQDPQSVYAAVIPKFIAAMLAGERPTIFGDGEQSRDFTCVEDCVAANLLACTAPGAAGQVLNIACGGRYTLNELVALLNRVLGTAIQPVYEPPRPGDVKHSQADISAARSALGYDPSTSFEEGLARTVEWFRNRG